MRLSCRNVGRLVSGHFALLSVLCFNANAAEKMERQPVNSSSIASIGYSPRSRTLDVEFRTGAIYRYEQVPSQLAREFLAAESKGRYFARRVRGKFPFKQLQR